MAKSSRLPAFGLMVGAPLILFWQLLAGGRVLYWGTPILQFFEWRTLVVEAYRSGHFPLWTESLGCGAPLLANLQSAALYPLNAIYFVFPVERAMGYSVIMHVILAGLFTFGFARDLGLRRTPALISALSYMLSGFLISRAQFLSVASSVPWLPLLMWLTSRVMRKRRAIDALLLGLAIAVQLLAGHAQLWYYSLWAVGLYALFLGGRSLLRSRGPGSPSSTPGSRRVWLSWGLMLVALVTSLLAASAQILPTAELTHVSQRAGGTDYDFAMNYSFWPWRLITLVSPDFFGNPADGDFWGYGNYWEDCGYLGILPLILGLGAIVAWVRRRQDRSDRVLSQVPFFAVLCVVALVLAMGKNLPLYPVVWRYVPGFGLFQAPSRFLYLYTFGMALLAGIGLQFLTASKLLARVSRYLIAIALSMLLTVGIGRLLLTGHAELTFIRALTTTSFLAVGAGVLLLLRTQWITDRRQQWWNTLVAGFVAIDLLVFCWPLNPTAETGLYHWVTDSGSFLRQQAAGAAEPFRVFSFDRFVAEAMFDDFFRFNDFGPSDRSHLQRLREMLLPNLPAIEGLDSANGYDPLQVGNHQDMVEYVEHLPGRDAHKLLGLMNVRYIVGDQNAGDDVPAYSGQVDIFENPEFLPRAYVVYRERVAKDDALDLSVLSNEDFDPEREVLLSSPGSGISAGHSEVDQVALSTVTALRYRANGVTIDASLKRDGYVVLSDTYYPGWRAVVDGKEQPVLRANYAFRASALPPGDHHVTFEYDPQSFKLGLLIGGTTWLCALVTILVLCLKERFFDRSVAT